MQPSSLAIPPLTSRRTRLRPPTQPFLDELYELATTDQIPWQWNTPDESPQSFHQSLYQNVLVGYMIEDRRNGRGVGYLSAYGPNFHHRYCYVSMFLHPAFKMRVWPLEGAVIFANYVFMKFDMRNIYMETTGAHIEQFKSGMGVRFQVEGHFRNRLLLYGQPQDLYVLTVTREQWLESGVRAVERCTVPADQRARNSEGAVQRRSERVAEQA